MKIKELGIRLDNDVICFDLVGINILLCRNEKHKVRKCVLNDIETEQTKDTLGK
jgi:hypothetical protein